MLVKKRAEGINGSIKMSKKGTSNHTEFQSTQKAEEICPDSLPSQTVVMSCHMTHTFFQVEYKRLKCCKV
jgi:hypothetical protein